MGGAFHFEAATPPQNAPRPFGRTTRRHGRGCATERIFPLARTAPIWYTNCVFGKADGKSDTRTANPKNTLAPCAIGLPFAGMSDPVTQGVYNMKSGT